MEKIWREKSCRYSIRKLTVGTASVLLGAVFLASHTVSADTTEVKQTRLHWRKLQLRQIPLRKQLNQPSTHSQAKQLTIQNQF